jgi:hypothetical protein
VPSPNLAAALLSAIASALERRKGFKSGRESDREERRGRLIFGVLIELFRTSKSGMVWMLIDLIVAECGVCDPVSTQFSCKQKAEGMVFRHAFHPLVLASYGSLS